MCNYDGTQYSVILLYRMQTSTFTLKMLIFSPRFTTSESRDITSQITLNVSLARPYFKHLNICQTQLGLLGFGIGIVKQLPSKTKKTNICQNDCACAYHKLYFYILYLKSNAKNCCKTVRSTQGHNKAIRIHRT